MDLFPILLYLHALGAIIAFGPGFAAIVVGPMVAKEPQYANFYARTQLVTARRITMPVAGSMAITGLGMIALRGWDTITGGGYWLPLGILLYVIAVGYSMGVQARAGRRLVELTAQPPAPGTPPSPELAATVARVRQGGMLLAALVVVIVYLMVARSF